MLPADQLVVAIKAKARELGFDLVGIAPAFASERTEFWRRWLADGKAGTMDYLAERIAERLDPSLYLMAEAQSAVCVAVNYHVPPEQRDPQPGEVPGRIARYAWPADYHETIKDRLYDLADYIREIAPGSRTRAAIDTAPIAERELSARAGIGWIGKNTCVMNTEIGSWIFLGTVVTSLALPPDGATPDRCGTCTRCLDACPTDALSPDRPYQIDARQCISYLTIEHRGEIPPEFHEAIGDWLYGCDICQDVCPWNRRAPVSVDPAFSPRFPSGWIDAHAALELDDDGWRAISRKTAMRRVKLPQLHRNAGIVVKNAERAGRFS